MLVGRAFIQCCSACGTRSARKLDTCLQGHTNNFCCRWTPTVTIHTYGTCMHDKTCHSARKSRFKAHGLTVVHEKSISPKYRFSSTFKNMHVRQLMMMNTWRCLPCASTVSSTEGARYTKNYTITPTVRTSINKWNKYTRLPVLLRMSFINIKPIVNLMLVTKTVCFENRGRKESKKKKQTRDIWMR